jgi:ATP-binding cassette subfamily B protein/subfamily B ATP-binding cassette protein MsbA
MVRIDSSFLRLLGLLREHKRSLIFILLSGLLIAAGQAVFAKLLKTLMDSLEHPELRSIYQIAGGILALTLVVGVFRYFHLLATDTLVERFIMQLRLRLQAKLFQSSQLILDSTQHKGSGQALSRIMNDLTTIQHGLRFVVDFIREPLSFLFLLGWMIYLNASLTISIIIVLPLLLRLMKKINQSVAKYAKLSQEQMEQVTQAIKENLDGVRVIQSYNLQELALTKLRKRFEDFYNFRKQMLSRIHLASPMAEWVGMIVGLFVIVKIATDIATGRATYGDFTSYVGALLMLGKPIKTVQEASVRLQEVIVASRRLFEILDAPEPLSPYKSTQVFPDTIETICFDKVSLKLGERVILNPCSFEIRRGEKVAFVGPSGSGKSSVLNLLCRFLEYSEGEILINGISIRHFDPLELRKHLALVTQEVFLFSESIAENLRLVRPDVSEKEIQSRLEQVGLGSWLQQLPSGIHTNTGERGAFVSGGERQRLSIARALIKEAPVLLLDEATSQLDTKNETIVMDLLRQQAKEQTLIWVAHRLSTVKNFDRIFVFDQGRLREQGTHEVLLAQKGLYFQLWSSQTM